jgi:diguanylate cyclase (GGDEF)-like protein
MDVLGATDLFTGLRRALNDKPDVILAQMHLPASHGFDLLLRLKEEVATQSIPVILYARRATTEDRVRALDLGAIDLLSKPFGRAELVARVRAALRFRHTLCALEQRAHLDGLTGLANRGAFEDQLLREWNVHRRYGTALSIVIADLDHFKAINDTFGHSAGDEVLRQTARLLAGSARRSDLIARYGGEEFVVLAPKCSLHAAGSLARRFRAALAELVITSQGTRITVTASIGVAAADWAHDTPMSLFRRADHALYQAKKSGRDAIWLYDPDQHGPAKA